MTFPNQSTGSAPETVSSRRTVYTFRRQNYKTPK